jgi:hypothetical protein
MTDKKCVDTGSICEFCGKSFSCSYNLKVHTKSAKYCLSLRNEKPSVIYPCEYCDFQSTNKYSLNTHVKTCVAHKEYIIEEKDKELDEKNKEIIGKDKTIAILNKNVMRLESNDLKQQTLIKDQQKTIEKLKVRVSELEKEVSFEKGIVTGIDKGIDKAATTTKPQIVVNKTDHSTKTNNRTNNKTNNGKIINKKLALVPITHIQPLTLEYVKSKINEYDYDKYKNGRKGVTQFIENLILLDMEDGTTQKNMVCTDRSRNAFHRLVQNKEWKSDAGATYLNTILNNITDQVLIHDQTLQNEIDLITDEIKLNRRNNNNNDISNNKRDKLIKFSESLRPIYVGITVPKSKDRTDLFESIRNDIRDKCTITTEG